MIFIPFLLDEPKTYLGLVILTIIGLGILCFCIIGVAWLIHEYF
jgi:hypothetical protein